MASHASFFTALPAAALLLSCACVDAGPALPVAAAATVSPVSTVQEAEHLYAAPTRPDRIGRVVAPVTINGLGPFRMILDTGANQSVLTTSVASFLGLEPAADRMVRLNGVTGSRVVPTVIVDRFETGDLLQENLQMAIMNTVSGGAEGILGMQGFSGKRITIDFANDRVQIANSRGQRAGANFVAVPVKIRFGRLLLASGRVGGVKVHTVIDTGAERTLGNLALHSELIRRKRLPAPPTVTGVIGVTDVEQRGHAIYTRKITLGDMTITDVDVIYGDIHVFKLWDLEQEPALLLGMDVLGSVAHSGR